MDAEPINNGGITGGRHDDGKFAPGNAGGGKPRGARHKVTRAVEELLEGQHEALTQKAISKALEGDMIALRLCLDRIAPQGRMPRYRWHFPPFGLLPRLWKLLRRF